MNDEECIHLNDPALCTICNGKDAANKPRPRSAPKPVVQRLTPKETKPAASTTRLTRTVAPTQSLDTPESVEQYRSRFAADRQETFDAYVEVFFATDARQFPGGWTHFSRCAAAEPERKETAPALVARAEALMRGAGYVADDTGRPVKARRWYLDS
ncbi:MAG TPA: hypothetical protein VMZ22_03805 [Acidimicrobiales bacterium]|nr:hypothetical protein [Acidimicrobiales bacterium]